jgi:hypothetical protein
MILPTGDQLDHISNADLVALVKALIAGVERLEAAVNFLKHQAGCLIPVSNYSYRSIISKISYGAPYSS